MSSLKDKVSSKTDQGYAVYGSARRHNPLHRGRDWLDSDITAASVPIVGLRANRPESPAPATTRCDVPTPRQGTPQESSLKSDQYTEECLLGEAEKAAKSDQFKSLLEDVGV